MKNYHQENKENLQNYHNSKKVRTFGQEIKSRLRIPQTPATINKIALPQPINNQQTYNSNQNNPQNYRHNKITFGNNNHVSSLASLPALSERSKSGKNVKFSQSHLQCSSTKHSSSSILKNKLLVKGGNLTCRSTFSEKNSLKNSLKSSMISSGVYQEQEQQSCENLGTNKVLKQKYQKLLYGLKKGNRKYTDQIFPPIRTSLESTNTNTYIQYKWLRVNEVFKGKHIVLWSNNPSKRNTITTLLNTINPLTYFATVLNSIKNNLSLMEKIFESQIINEYGIYYLKINHNNMWKYIIIDDYIPVIKTQNGYVPAFINTLNTRQVQIWPYLLLKAYAKSYCTYHNILQGNQLDFICQLTMNTYSVIKVENQQIVKDFISKNTNYDMLLGKDRQERFHPINVQQQNTINYEDSSLNYCKRRLSVSQFSNVFKEIYQINSHQYFHCIQSLIRSKQKQEIILKSFKIDESDKCELIIVQKDARLYSSAMRYKYSWIRMMLMMKENNSYRWIGGVYSNEKNVKWMGELESGQYFLIILPEWSHPYDLSLNYRGNTITKLQRKHLKNYPNILTESCMDLAQRYGKLIQINPNICSYNYIHQQLGLIIQNINNERPKGDVKIQRSIDGLVGRFPIQSLNKEFKDNNVIEVTIPKNQHYTVILKLIGGIDLNILQLFDFGS